MQHPPWLAWAQRIQAIAQTGLTYSKDPYDLERYQELRDLACEILGAQTGADPAKWLAALAPEKGYPTPKVDVRGVVFDGQGRLLLVRERAEGLWSLPGGWADGGGEPGDRRGGLLRRGEPSPALPRPGDRAAGAPDVCALPQPGPAYRLRLVSAPIPA